jgi:SPP1 family predicted phage head-tail adaptor
MQAGRLKNRVVIQQQSTTQDSIGQPVNTWTTYATVWANIIHQKGAEAIKADQVMSTLRASIRVRYKAGITTAMRVSYASKIYQIISIIPDAESKDYMDLVCEVYGG